MNFQIHKSTNYTHISVYHLREREMTLKAKGLLTLMLSLPENWDYSISGLVSICKENESAIISTLKELKDFGYLVIEKKMPNQTKTGRIEYEYHIFEKSIKQAPEKQDLENQGLEIQGLENQAQYNNTNILKSKKENIKEKSINILDYLNEKAGTHYRPVDSNLKFIQA